MSIHDDHDAAPATPEPTPEAAPRPGLGGSTTGLALVAAVLGALSVGLWDVPGWAAAVGVAILVFVAWWTRPRPTQLGFGRRARGGRRSPWPDLGMKTVVDALDDPCILVDAAGTVRWVNREATVRYGTVRPGDPLSFGLRVTALRDAFDRVVALVRAETVEWQEKVPTERWMQAHLAPIHNPRDPDADDRRPDFVLLRIEDLTESRRVERMRADFVANASHELRTPLAAITGFIETLQGPARDDHAVHARFLAIMAEQAGRMKRLIDDLLSLSRVEMRAHLRPETTVDLAEILPHVVDLVRPAADAAGVDVTLRDCDHPQPVRGDREELIQVFTNLAENAVKYGGSGGRIEISIADETGAGRSATVAVRDFGPGIAPMHLPRLTERFYRAHTDKSGEKRGTGLGLAIVKHIVTRHGGRLGIDSTPGEGSTFSVRLDRPESSSASEKAVRNQ